MPDLSHKAAAEYWHEYTDPMIYRVVTFLESVEDWTLDGNAQLEQLMDELGKELDDISAVDIGQLGHEELFIRLVGNIKSGRGLRLLQAIDVAHPGSASKVLIHAEETSISSYDPAGFFLKRNIVFERLRLLARTFSEYRLKLVERAIEGGRMMMKKICTLLLSTLLLITPPLVCAADEYTPNTAPPDDDNGPLEGIKKLVLYLDNLGKFLGYNLEIDEADAPVPNSSLLTYVQDASQQGSSMHKAWETLAYYSVFAAIPVNAFQSTLQAFTQDDYAGLNQWANKTFTDPSAYNDESSQDSISVVKNVDQKTYQKDPVNQAVLNMVGTPDASFCGALSADAEGHCVSQSNVIETLLKDVSVDGILPGTDAVFSYDNTQKFLSQLNPNTLIAPLLYTSGGGGGGGGGGNSDKGLPSGSQEQQAADFIRYATGVSLTMGRVTRDDYDALWSAAYPITNGDIKKSTDTNGMNAQQSLEEYLTNLRVFAAQGSVASSNLYAILSKRMPLGTKDRPHSQALDEFKMATWRLNNPDEKDPQKQWLDQINTASAATVQKEVAILLSEINYQMYLSRQQDERLLLTNSMILMQALAQNRPEAPTAENVRNQETTPAKE